MRMNVYHEELTRETEVVETTSKNGVKYYGFRIFLKSHPDLHHTEEDDDRSAVTFWFGDKTDCEYMASYWKLPSGAVTNQPYREGGTGVIDGTNKGGVTTGLPDEPAVPHGIGHGGPM